MSRHTQHPGLVLAEELKQDNRTLLRALAKVHRGAKNADPVAFKEALDHFQHALAPHLVKKAAKLYSHLRQQAKAWGQFEEYERVTAYKTEMTRIVDAALRFAQVHRSAPAVELDFVQIRTTLSTLGHLLSERLRREEQELYPLLFSYS